MIANIFSVRLPSGALGMAMLVQHGSSQAPTMIHFAEMQSLYSDFATCQTKSDKVQIQYI